VNNDRKTSLLALIAAVAILALPARAFAQAVTIKREPLNLTDPAKYNIPLKTAPVKSVEITAPMEGYVR